MNNSTISYYNKNALSYSLNTFNLDMNSDYQHFLEDIPLNGKILDAGCGSGRDLLFFKKLGYQAIGIDASPELALIAHENSGANVICKSFLDINYDCEFDAIWCVASLLHLPKEVLPIALLKLTNSLKKGGKIFASFK